jgi:hypothetical protein
MNIAPEIKKQTIEQINFSDDSQKQRVIAFSKHIDEYIKETELHQYDLTRIYNKILLNSEHEF